MCFGVVAVVQCSLLAWLGVNLLCQFLVAWYWFCSVLEVDKALIKRFGEKPLVQPFYDDCVV